METHTMTNEQEQNRGDKPRNRVRISGGGPFVSAETEEEIRRRSETFGISLGRVIDEAITATAAIKGGADNDA